MTSRGTRGANMLLLLAAACAGLLLATAPLPAGAGEVDKFERKVGYSCRVNSMYIDEYPGQGKDKGGNTLVWENKFTDFRGGMQTEEDCAVACADTDMPFVCTAYEYTKSPTRSSSGSHCKFTNNPWHGVTGNKKLQFTPVTGTLSTTVCGVLSKFLDHSHGATGLRGSGS